NVAPYLGAYHQYGRFIFQKYRRQKMMLKFRVWDTVKKAMHEVQAIVYVEENVYPIYSNVVRRYIPFSEAILMQSTGLFDKNGKEIFEGDIVRMHSGELLPVKLHHGMFEPVCYYASRAFGRVGNVFENPELLEHPDFREG
ncbi:YopX family protein, partial [Streptococcus suis]